MSEPIKPKCSCGLEMQVVRFYGYYKQFKYFELHKDCKCGTHNDANRYEKEDRKVYDDY